MQALHQSDNEVLTAPPDHWRIVGFWPLKPGKPCQFFRHGDYTSLQTALEIAASLNEELMESEEAAQYRVYDDFGMPVQEHL